MNDDPKLLKINHTIINMRQVTHITYQETEPREMTVYFTTGKEQMYEGDAAKLLWEHMQTDTDLETVH